jgi:Fe-S oxidoreductase
MLKYLGPEILGTGRAKGLAETVMPLSQFILKSARAELEALLHHGSAALAVTYHDSCHHKHVLGAVKDSREALEVALGKKIREMEDSDACCGFAGFFSVSHPEVSASLLEDKLESIRRSQADVVALDCPGCLLQIKGGFKARRAALSVKHTIEVVEARLAGKL